MKSLLYIDTEGDLCTDMILTPSVGIKLEIFYVYGDLLNRGCVDFGVRFITEFEIY